MNTALKLCSLALNPTAPSPFASMVKVDQGFMIAYGGTFCIRVPVEQEIGAAFEPKSLMSFFRKERPQVAYTIKFPKLTIKEGKERLTINCLPPEDLVTIDNIETPTPCTLNVKNLKIAAQLIDPSNSRPFALGVAFKDGAMMSTNNAVFFMGEAGVDDTFSIPKEAALAICKFESPVVSFSRNDHTIKFTFEDGSSLCTNLIAEQFPDLDPLFEGDWSEFEVTDDISKVDCDDIEIEGNVVRFYTETSVGEIEGIVKGKTSLKCKKKFFNLLLSISGKMEAVPKQKVKVEGDDCVMISSMITR